MTIENRCKKINHQRYYNVIRTCVILNGDDRPRPLRRFQRFRKSSTGHAAWQLFKQKVRTIILPVEEMSKYASMFKHLNIDPNGKMAWGFTGKNEWYWFVTDSRDPRIFMQNVGPGFHEVLHMLMQLIIGTSHINYQRSEPPEVRRLPQTGPAATVVVHDNWYGYKTSIRVWFAHSIWVPTRMPYIPVWKVREMYKL